MDKIKNNIEHNLPIYLLIIAVVVLAGIYVGRKEISGGEK